MIGINNLRQINKFHPNEMPTIVDQFLNKILELFSSTKTIINKTLLIFL